jgi:N-terminal domain of ribose phosphate pyrophosphokinase
VASASAWRTRSAALNGAINSAIEVKLEENVRGRDVFIVQSGQDNPNDPLIELLFLVDAARRVNARSVNAVLPYFPYGKGDKRDEPRVSSRCMLDCAPGGRDPSHARDHLRHARQCWVHQLALTAHLGQPMLGIWDWFGLAVCLALAVLGLSLSAPWGIKHRDLAT